MGHLQRGRAIALGFIAQQHAQKIVFIPGRAQSFGLESALVAIFLREQIQAQTAHNSQVFCGIFDSHATLILTKSHIQAPMHVVFHAPVGARGL